jgi:hypothetical protein
MSKIVRIKTYIFAVVLLVLLMEPQAWAADSTASREYQIKAAFLYNFLMFVDWPPGKMADGNEPIIIGIIGKDQFENAFEPVKNKLVNNKKVIVKRFKPFEELKKSDKAKYDQEIEAIRKCHLLYICRSEETLLKEILNLIEGQGVLTVTSMDKFIESGSGVINFVMEEDKVRFEINLTAAKQAKIKIRSQLLRLAKKVIGGDSLQEARN